MGLQWTQWGGDEEQSCEEVCVRCVVGLSPDSAEAVCDAPLKIQSPVLATTLALSPQSQSSPQPLAGTECPVPVEKR
jgi:hypothetical protein